MKDLEKSKEQLVDELLEVRRQVSEMKRTEDALRLSEAKYRQLHQSMMDAFVSVNMDGFIQECNAAYCQMLGYTPEELVKLRYSEITPEKWHPLQAEIIEKQVLTRGYSDIYEKEFQRKDGTIFPVELRTCILKDDQNQPITMWAIIRDITERKRAEAELKKAHDELERRVAERTAELAKANKALQHEVEERKQVENNLRQSRDHLQAIYDGMSDGLLIADIETKRFVQANASMCKMLGYSETELLTKSVEDIHPPEALPFVIDQFHALAEGRLRASEDVPVLRKDGSVFYAVVSSSKVDNDNRHCVVGFFRDSTERKQAEEALQKSEERFRSYFEQGLMGMALSNREMQWTEVNNRFCEILGYSREESLQQKITDFVHPDNLESFRSSYQKLLIGEIDHYTAERRLIGKDGRAVYLNIFVKGFRSPDGMADHVFALFEDVTERVNAQIALRQSHDELQAIYDGMVDGLLIADVETKLFIRANAAICGMLGYSRDELLNKSVMDIHPASELPAVLKVFQAQAAGQIVVNENAPVQRKDGSVFFADIATNRISYDTRPCLVGFFRDATERRAAHESLQREHRTLNHLLQSSDHERQTIAYEIHDGLAQYLAAALMQFDVYKSQREKRPNEAAKAYDVAVALLSQGHSEARRLIAGIRHPVLDEAGVVEAVAHLINEQNREKGPKIEFRSLIDFSRLIPLLENAIYRIIQEGMTNACKYSESRRVRITLVQQKDRLRIEIRDWGIGFNPKDVKEGSYGLIGIRERARLLGGKFRIQSAADKGTRITVELPLMERDE